VVLHTQEAGMPTDDSQRTAAYDQIAKEEGDAILRLLLEDDDAFLGKLDPQCFVDLLLRTEATLEQALKEGQLDRIAIPGSWCNVVHHAGSRSGAVVAVRSETGDFQVQDPAVVGIPRHQSEAADAGLAAQEPRGASALAAAEGAQLNELLPINYVRAEVYGDDFGVFILNPSRAIHANVFYLQWWAAEPHRDFRGSVQFAKTDKKPYTGALMALVPGGAARRIVSIISNCK
jgi:hypothetical protein